MSAQKPIVGVCGHPAGVYADPDNATGKSAAAKLCPDCHLKIVNKVKEDILGEVNTIPVKALIVKYNEEEMEDKFPGLISEWDVSKNCNIQVSALSVHYLIECLLLAMRVIGEKEKCQPILSELVRLIVLPCQDRFPLTMHYVFSQDHCILNEDIEISGWVVPPDSAKNP